MAAHPPDLSLTPEHDALCDRFEDALQRGERPPLQDCLAAAGDRAPGLLVELAALELHYRVLAGEPAAAADYLDRFPQWGADSEVALRLVAVEYRAAVQRGTHMTETEFRRRYPALAARPEWADGPWTSRQLEETRLSPATAQDGTDDGSHERVEPLAFLRGFLAPPLREADLGRLADYHVQGVLGAGGMGIVLAADDPALGRGVAIKLMRPEAAQMPRARERFLREARSAAAVEHPRVVVVHSVGEWNGVPYLVMPRMRGRSLADRLRQPPPLSREEAVRFLREAADGLSAAHARGLIHRDVKPANIWLEDTAEGTHVRLLDFGLARGDDSPVLTEPGRIVGTPNYMAPEQADGEAVDPRADLFSLGCVLYELLTGRKAFPGRSTLAVLSALAGGPPQRPSALDGSIPAPLCDLTMRLLEKERNARPASAEAVAAELRRIEKLLGEWDGKPPTNGPVPVKEADGGTTIAYGSTDARSPFAKTAEVSRRRVAAREIGIGVAVLTLAALAFSARSWMPNDKSGAMPPASEPGAGAATPDSSPPVASAEQVVGEPPVAEPLWVKSIDLGHYARDSISGLVEFRDLLGVDSFHVTLHDGVQITATLSRPAYAYLIAFRPDGEDDVCFPEQDDVPPPLVDTLQYPPQDRNTGYGLDEGAGLWVFAVVASQQPLPPYREWRQIRSLLEWRPIPSCATGIVWWDDGQGHLEVFSEESRESRTRGKGAPLRGPHTSIWMITDALRSIEGIDTVSAKGFCVAPRAD